MNALVVAGGNAPDRTLMKKLYSECELIIGADKGARYLLDANILPTYIVGDFDSLEYEYFNCDSLKGIEKIVYSSEKDYSDSKLAFDLAIEKGAKNIYLFSVTGTRLDHSFSNFGLLKDALRLGVNSCIIDNNNYIYMVERSTTFKRKEGYRYISFLAYEGSVEGLSIVGAKYKLENYNLVVGDSRTISNQFEEEQIDISFKEGKLLAIYSKD